MKKIDIDEIPVLEFDAGIPDSKWGETTASAATTAITEIIILLTNP